jgi:hypothetical protein
MHTIKTEGTPVIVPISTMKVGQVGIIYDPKFSCFDGLTVMRTYNSYVALNDPSKTWSIEPNHPNFLVTIYPKDTILTIKLGN